MKPHRWSRKTGSHFFARCFVWGGQNASISHILRPASIGREPLPPRWQDGDQTRKSIGPGGHMAHPRADDPCRRDLCSSARHERIRCDSLLDGCRPRDFRGGRKWPCNSISSSPRTSAPCGFADIRFGAHRRGKSSPRRTLANELDAQRIARDPQIFADGLDA